MLKLFTPIFYLIKLFLINFDLFWHLIYLFNNIFANLWHFLSLMLTFFVIFCNIVLILLCLGSKISIISKNFSRISTLKVVKRLLICWVTILFSGSIWAFFYLFATSSQIKVLNINKVPLLLLKKPAFLCGCLIESPRSRAPWGRGFRYRSGNGT